jgi:hypothetical protein
VHPGNIETPYLKSLQHTIGGGLKFTCETLGAIYSQPEGIDYSILFLASGESSFCSAIELVLDGGMKGAAPPVYPDVTYPVKKRIWIN